MSSGYSGEFMHGVVGGGGGGGAGRGNGTVRPATMAGLQGGVMYGNRVPQSQFQQQQQQQQQVPGMMLQDQIKQRRVDPFMGKRSLADYQSYQQHLQILQQHQQQQPVASYIQRFQQQQQQQQQQQGSKSRGSTPPTLSSGMLSLSTPVSFANTITSDSSKAKGGLQSQGFNAAQSGQLLPASFPYLNSVSPTVPVKPAEQKQPAGE